MREDEKVAAAMAAAAAARVEAVDEEALHLVRLAMMRMNDHQRTADRGRFIGAIMHYFSAMVGSGTIPYSPELERAIVRWANAAYGR